MAEDDEEPAGGKRRFRLSVADLLYVTVCFSIALTVAVPLPPEASIFPGWQIYQPHIDWQYALLGVATLGAIGVLVQQVRQLLASRQWGSAAVERGAAVLPLVLVLGFRILTQRGVLEIAENEENMLPSTRQIQDAVWVLLLIVGVRIAAGERPRRTNFGVRWGWVALTPLVAWFVMLMAAFKGVITFLVYVAIAGNEANISPRFVVNPQGADLPTVQAIAGWSLYAGLAFMTAVAAAVAALSLRPFTVGKAVVLAAIGSSGLAGAAWFSCWYYCCGYAELSPCLASTTPVANLSDAVVGTVAVLAVAVWVARSLSTRPASTNGGVPTELPRRGGVSLLLLLAGGLGFSALALTELVLTMFSWTFNAPFRMGPASWEEIGDMLCDLFTDSHTLLLLALMLASFWLLNAWRRDEPVSVAGVNPRRFFAVWMLFVLMAAVGAPTLAAYSLCAWLRPW